MSAPSRQALLVGLAFALAVLLSLPSIAPSLAGINPFDEAKYIDSGRSLVVGQPRDLAWGPLLSAVYAPIYLAVQGSPHWFVLSAAIGRLFLFGLLWLSVFRLGTAFRSWTSPLVLAGMMFVSVVPAALLANSSDALLAALGALALGELAFFARGGSSAHLTRGSLWVGLATLTRLDGIAMFAIFAVLALVLARGRNLGWRALIRLAAPFAVIVAGYTVAHAMINGRFEVSIAERSYTAFEQGQWTVTGSDWDTAVLESRRLFGEPDQNQRSILRAALRNPAAFADRVRANLRLAPELALQAYDKRHAPVLALLALVGIARLIRGRDRPALGILLLWPAYLVTYCVTFFRFGYLLSAFYPLFVLGAIGLTRAAATIPSVKGRAVWSGALAAAVLVSILSTKPAFAIALTVALVCLWLYWIAAGKRRDLAPAGLALFLAGAIVLRDGFAYGGVPHFGETPQERAVAFLVDRFPTGSRIAAPTPLVPLAARMTVVEVDLDRQAIGADLVDWMEDQAIAALVIDGSLGLRSSEAYAALQDEVGRSLVQLFVADPGSVQVLAPPP